VILTEISQRPHLVLVSRVIHVRINDSPHWRDHHNRAYPWLVSQKLSVRSAQITVIEVIQVNDPKI
jgi:hypothetical protein